MKALGAQIIAFGISMLVLSLVGFRLKLFWFLDAFGPMAAYFLKLGIVLLGAKVWCGADRHATFGKGITAESNGRAWIPVCVAIAFIIGIVSFLTSSLLKDSQLRQALNRAPAPAAWATVPPNLWPDLALMQTAKFSHHTPLAAGCACLVRLPTGEICALTAGHLLGSAGGVSPGFMRGGSGELDKDKLATLDSEITSWKLFLPDAKDQPLDVIGLYGQHQTNGRRL